MSKWVLKKIDEKELNVAKVAAIKIAGAVQVFFENSVEYGTREYHDVLGRLKIRIANALEKVKNANPGMGFIIQEGWKCIRNSDRPVEVVGFKGEIWINALYDETKKNPKEVLHKVEMAMIDMFRAEKKVGKWKTKSVMPWTGSSLAKVAELYDTQRSLDFGSSVGYMRGFDDEGRGVI